MDTHNILLVDDDVVVLEVLGGGLRDLGHLVTVCSGGEKALLALQESTFDMIVVDFEMPGMSGLELSRELANRSQPFLFLTSHDSASIAERAAKCGAFGYLVKPCTPEHLLLQIKASIRRHSQMSGLKHAPEIQGLVSLAAGLIMAHGRLDRGQTLSAMRSYCRPRNLKLTALSEKVVAEFERSQGTATIRAVLEKWAAEGRNKGSCAA